MSLLDQIKNNEEIEFDEVMIFIAENYDFTPTSFTNGNQENKENENNGSCKLFAFAQMYALTKQQTLNCFGIYYRKDVIGNPEGTNHSNIRNFIVTGWEGIKFPTPPLAKK